MNRNEIIDRIGYIRVRAKMTQRALSLAIDMNPNYINRLESKRNFLPSLEVLMRIIEECGSCTEEFFYRDFQSYDKDRKSLEQLKNLPQEVKDFLGNCDEDILKLFSVINKKIKKTET